MTTYTRSQAYTMYKDDYLYHDGVETVTVYLASGGTLSNVSAKLELPQETVKQLGEGIIDTSIEAMWVVWDSTLSGSVLHEDDVIQRGSGERWRIKDASRQLWDTQWHCQTKKDRT